MSERVKELEALLRQAADLLETLVDPDKRYVSTAAIYAHAIRISRRARTALKEKNNG